jgi:hypothetical protein
LRANDAQLICCGRPAAQAAAIAASNSRSGRIRRAVRIGEGCSVFPCAVA